MRIIVATGGTAGHINPALAVARQIRIAEPDSQILFVGKTGAVESRLVPAAGFEFRGFVMHSFARTLKLDALWWNFKLCFTLLKNNCEFRKLLREFKPEAVIGFGGYTSYPIVRLAARKRIPTAIHEQNSYPGLANKTLADKVDLIFLSFENAAKVLGNPEKTIISGNPVSPELYTADREKERAKLGIGKRVCIVSFGGSKGALAINKVIIALMKRELDEGGFYHIHAVGKRDKVVFDEMMRESGIDSSNPSLDIREYIDNMPQVLAAADLVISRAGASSVFEIAAAGRGSILIPSPEVTENHQYHNAMALKAVGGAIIIEQSELSEEKLISEVMRLVKSKNEIASFGINARRAARPDSQMVIYSSLRKLIDGKKNV